MKVAREEFDRFWDDVLGSDWYDDGDESLDDETTDAVVDLVEIVPRWQAYQRRPEPKGLLKERDFDGDFLAVSASALFKRWRKSQTTTVVTASFEVAHEGKTALLEQIKALKGKVLS